MSRPLLIGLFATFLSLQLPLVGLPTAGTSAAFAQYQTMSKSCGKCGGAVSVSSTVGGTCPHCGVRWGGENTRQVDGFPGGTDTYEDGRHPIAVLAFGLIAITVIGFFLAKNFDVAWATVFGDGSGKRKVRGRKDLKSPDGNSIPDEELSQVDLQYKYGMVEGAELYREIHNDD